MLIHYNNYSIVTPDFPLPRGTSGFNIRSYKEKARPHLTGARTICATREWWSWTGVPAGWSSHPWGAGGGCRSLEEPVVSAQPPVHQPEGALKCLECGKFVRQSEFPKHKQKHDCERAAASVAFEVDADLASDTTAQVKILWQQTKARSICFIHVTLAH